MRGIAHGAVVRVFNDRGAFARGDGQRRRYARRGSCSAGLLAQTQSSQATVQAVNSGKYADLGRAPTFSDNLVEVALAAAGR